MGKRTDDAIGSVVDKLKQAGVWENTLLFFISDNGGPLAQTADNKVKKPKSERKKNKSA